MYEILKLIASFIAVAIVLSLHEFAHAFVAYKNGDLTPKIQGRLTLNPLAHFDIFGLCMFAFAGFGWAKPVPINPNNFRHYKRGLATTAVAGVVMNYITAFLFYPIYLLIFRYVNLPWAPINYFLQMLPALMYMYSLSFCVFNLIPLPPLDGWRVVEAANRRRGKVFRFFQRYGNIILIVLIGIHFLVNILSRFEYFLIAAQIFEYIDILRYIMMFVTRYLGWPITALWGLVFGI